MPIQSDGPELFLIILEASITVAMPPRRAAAGAGVEDAIGEPWRYCYVNVVVSELVVYESCHLGASVGRSRRINIPAAVVIEYDKAAFMKRLASRAEALAGGEGRAADDGDLVRGPCFEPRPHG